MKIKSDLTIYMCILNFINETFLFWIILTSLRTYLITWVEEITYTTNAMDLSVPSQHIGLDW